MFGKNYEIKFEKEEGEITPARSKMTMIASIMLYITFFGVIQNKFMDMVNWKDPKISEHMKITTHWDFNWTYGDAKLDPELYL